ncbi:MAG: cation-translocating P-type ATPase [Hyphomicrobiaceae bacterium]
MSTGPTGAPAQPIAWHALSADETAARLDCRPATGLSASAVEQRRARYGTNTMTERPPRTLLDMIADQFKDFMIVVLMAAAIISGLVGELTDTLVILVIVVLNAAIGVVQEWRAETALAALRRMSAPSAHVRRDGHAATIPAHELVPGDVVMLSAGDLVPADVRLVETATLRLDESMLTGESVSVAKTAEPTFPADTPVAERHNLAFKGTMAVNGHATGVVVATGMRTELGRIAGLIDTAERVRTPLQQRLSSFGRRLGLVVMGLCAIIFVFGVLRGEPILLMLLTAISLAVAAVPEALPAVVTITLALGARQMMNRKALVRALPAVETLGSVSYICTDKTGTLTLNRMRVDRLSLGAATWAQGEMPPGDALPLLTAMALCSDVEAGQDGALQGDPTETAISRAAVAAGFVRRDMEAETPRIGEHTFDAERKRMTTLHRDGGGIVAYTKGAPESVLPLCARRLADGREQPIVHEAMLAHATGLAEEGLRVIAFARRIWPGEPADASADGVEQELTLIGFVGLIDPPRPEAAEAVRSCLAAGIVPVMITGDHPGTARAIAERLGIIDGSGAVMTGAELQSLDDAALERRVSDIRVYARVDPAQKIRIVEALQRRGAFVAMTGDGVNDAPALKRANIGVAMGNSGTDVAKEASSLVLLDDNFATIVGAVRAGRRIYDNIRKFIKYTMTSNSGEIWTIFLAPFLGLPVPLLPIHILWINLVTDGLPGLALAAEGEERGIMQRLPRPPDESIFAHGMWQHIVWCGLAMGLVCLAIQSWAITNGHPNWQTMVFTVLTLSQMGHVLAIRSERDSLFTQGFWSNRPLVGATLLTLALQLAVIYVPLFNSLFNTSPLSLVELGVCLLASSAIFVMVEIEKMLVRRGLIYRS